MSEIFKINQKGDALISSEARKLCPELKDVSPEQLLYIIRVYDYVDSPYRKKPINERRNVASSLYPQKRTYLQIEKEITEAIERYRGLIFSPRRTTNDIYISKIAQLQEIFITTNDPSDLKDITVAINHITNQIENNEKIIDEEAEQEIVLKGSKKISFTEKWKRNIADYNKQQLDGVSANNQS